MSRHSARTQVEDDTKYRHRQFSRPILVSWIAMTAMLGVSFFYISRDLNDPVLVMTMFAGIVLETVGHYVLSSLTVEVSASELSWYFGPGFWRKRIARSTIAQVTPTRLPWWYGIGIKYTPDAWVYLVAPGNGVTVMTTNGKAVRIGTDDVKGLMAALNRDSPAISMTL
jgi:hypothetical protein